MIGAILRRTPGGRRKESPRLPGRAGPVRALSLLLCAAAGAAAAPAPAVPEAVPSSGTREMLRRTVESLSAEETVTVAGERLFSTGALRAFYELRLFHPAWVKGGEPFGAVDELLGSLRGAGDDGLRPGDYHLEAIVRLLDRARRHPEAGSAPPAPLVELELLCSDAFFLLGSHLLAGRVDPETFDVEWESARKVSDLAALLRDALEEGGVSQSLSRLNPSDDGFARLKGALARYRAIAGSGGWPAVPPGPSLEEGDRGPRVAALRAALHRTGDLPGGSAPGGDAFDGDTLSAVISFQERHGLEVDGVAGPATLAALNIPASRRAGQIELNMERWRWLPGDLGTRRIMVNIADYRLDAFDGPESSLTMEVVVGRPYRRTPVFSSRVTYLVFNPHWNVPRSIAVRDKLPLIRENPAYLSDHGIRVLQGWGAETREVDPATVDWNLLGPRHFPYRLRQDPGPDNALGRVKFMFPNKFDVYLHDTPAKDLFDKRERPYSSGCIRVRRPLELAAFLLEDDTEWTPEAIAAAMEGGEERTVELPEPVPVHLVYWTAWVGEDGRVSFREDFYGRDRRLEEALSRGRNREE